MLVRYSAGRSYPIPIALLLFFPFSSSSSLLRLGLDPSRGGGRRGAAACLACGALHKKRLISPSALFGPLTDGRVTGVLPPALPPPSGSPRLRRPFCLRRLRRGLGGGGGRWFCCPAPDLTSFGTVLPGCCFAVAALARVRGSLRTGADTVCVIWIPACARRCRLNASMMVLGRNVLPSGPRVICLYCSSRPHSSHLCADHLVLAHLLPPCACSTAHLFLYTLISSAKCW